MKKYVETILEAAKEHGEVSEPDMEVRDLQSVLHLCWEAMTDAQRAAVADHWFTSDLVGEWL